MFNKCVFGFVLTLMASSSLAVEPEYWSSNEHRADPNRVKTYTATMHSRFEAIKGRYEDGGQYYYGDTLNSFGYKEPLNPQQQPIFCGAGDKTFSETVRAASLLSNGNTATHSRATAGDGVTTINSNGDEERINVKYDSSNFGISTAAMDAEILSTISGNSNSKGRFCRKINDSKVNFRNAGAATATYCDPSTSGAVSFTDPVSGFQCSFKLDSPLKTGETRYIRQLQGNYSTVAQGFLGCFNNEVTGAAELTAIGNPTSCTSSDRSSCIRSCDWAKDVVCDPLDMPKWGGGKCASTGTVIFKNDVINVNSSPALSFDTSSGLQYEGTAVMACSTVSGSAQWVVTSQSCLPVIP